MRLRHPEKLGDRLGDPDACDVSWVVAFEGWPDDLYRLHASLWTHLGPHDWEMVVVDLPVDDAASERIASLPRVVHVPLASAMGWAGARNLGLRRAAGRLTVVADTSIELTGDAVAPLGALLDDPAVGLVGRWGVVTDDGFAFEEPPDPVRPADVHGVEAYLMAARRSTFRDAGLFDAKFKWYRNADLDHSFRVRAAGLRTIVDPSLPVVRHEHRAWATTPDEERERLSRRNFFRFRDHWAAYPELFAELSG